MRHSDEQEYMEYYSDKPSPSLDFAMGVLFSSVLWLVGIVVYNLLF